MFEKIRTGYFGSLLGREVVCSKRHHLEFKISVLDGEREILLQTVEVNYIISACELFHTRSTLCPALKEVGTPRNGTSTFITEIFKVDLINTCSIVILERN